MYTSFINQLQRFFSPETQKPPELGGFTGCEVCRISEAEEGAFFNLELSSQVQRLTEENFIRRLPVKAFARSKVKFLNK